MADMVTLETYREMESRKDKRIEELETRCTELKEKYVKNICDCDICDTYCNSQLTEAKEIIKKLLALYYAPVVTKDDVKRQDEILAETEQFIKEIEK